MKQYQYSSVPPSWPRVKLEEACEGIFDCPHSTPKLTSQGPLLARSQDIRSGVFRTEQAAHISEETYKTRIRRAEPRYGDLLYSREGTYFGIAATVPPETRLCLGQRMVLIRPDRAKVDWRFLCYWLNSSFLSSYVSGHRDGSVAERLNLPTIRGLPVLLPPLVEQQHIAATLGALDDKIGLNGRMNQTLEAMARAIFKSWLADIELPGGLLPLGWSARPLSSVADFLNGAAMQRFPAADKQKSFPVIKIAELRKGETVNSQRAGLNVPSEYVIGDGDVLFSWSGTLEVVAWSGGRGALNQHIFKVTSKEFPKWFYFYWLKEHLPVFRSIAADKATTMGHIQRHHLSEALVAIPPDSVLEQAGAIMAPLLAKQSQNNLESRTLAAIRDTLLPKLLSGEVRVSQAEHLVGQVA